MLPTKNLYPLVLERGFDLVNGSGLLGWIVPVSSISTEGYSTLQELVFKRSGHFSSYDDRPSRLFDGLEHIQLTIHLIKAAIRKDPTWHVTECYRWNALERRHLFACIEYEPVSTTFLLGCVPKLSSVRERSLVNKVWGDGKNLGLQTQHGGSHVTYYSRKVHNFLQVLDFVPEVFDGNGNLRAPTELKDLAFAQVPFGNATFCALNSTLFRWWTNVFFRLPTCQQARNRGFSA